METATRQQANATRARESEGASDDAIHACIANMLRSRDVTTGKLVDIGCGTGRAAHTLSGFYTEYVGCDIVRYDGFPSQEGTSFVETDLENDPYPVPSATADIVVAIEVIEHLENPRSLVRELSRIVKPGGVVVLSTPNQLSLLSKLTLLLKNQFNAFQDAPGLYPSHITALLESDLVRIAQECNLGDVAIAYTKRGRVPFTQRTWPSALSRFDRAFSDNVILAASKPRA